MAGPLCSSIAYLNYLDPKSSTSISYLQIECLISCRTIFDCLTGSLHATVSFINLNEGIYSEFYQSFYSIGLCLDYFDGAAHFSFDDRWLDGVAYSVCHLIYLIHHYLI